MKKFLGSIGQIIIMALLYFVAARLSLLLAIPPGFATPVWPAAGIALAGGLIFGYPSLIGVFFGSLVANFYVAAGGFSEGLNFQAALVASAIAWGAFAQAALGTYLVRKRLSIPSTLSKLSNLLKIMFFGGVVACLVNATVGPLVLCVVGAVPLSELLLNMLVWWVGDVIGVILFAPLLLILAHSHDLAP